MDFVLQPWQFYVVIIAGWVNRQQQEVIEYLRTESGGAPAEKDSFMVDFVWAYSYLVPEARFQH